MFYDTLLLQHHEDQKLLSNSCKQLDAYLYLGCLISPQLLPVWASFILVHDGEQMILIKYKALFWMADMAEGIVVGAFYKTMPETYKNDAKKYCL